MCSGTKRTSCGSTLMTLIPCCRTPPPEIDASYSFVRQYRLFTRPTYTCSRHGSTAHLHSWHDDYFCWWHSTASSPDVYAFSGTYSYSWYFHMLGASTGLVFLHAGYFHVLSQLSQTSTHDYVCVCVCVTVMNLDPTTQRFILFASKERSKRKKTFFCHKAQGLVLLMGSFETWS